MLGYLLIQCIKGGIEIEIDTRADKRRLGLAKICASKMILECLDRGLYPSWDAHNPISLNLALSLGYVFDKKYVVYELIEK
ncbi:MAG: GNAT family N-acetyltransferase [Coprobacillus sp.]